MGEFVAIIDEIKCGFHLRQRHVCSQFFRNKFTNDFLQILFVEQGLVTVEYEKCVHITHW